MIERRNYKFVVADDCTVDIISDVVKAMVMYQQDDADTPESAGLLLGYIDTKSQNGTIADLTTPQLGDLRTRFFCTLRGNGHYDMLKLATKRKNYFMGTWHTHPQKDPCPSSIDWNDWRSTLTGFTKNTYRYVFFIILGTEKMRIWAGNRQNNQIIELCESERSDDIYVIK